MKKKRIADDLRLFMINIQGLGDRKQKSQRIKIIYHCKSLGFLAY